MQETQNQTSSSIKPVSFTIVVLLLLVAIFAIIKFNVQQSPQTLDRKNSEEIIKEEATVTPIIEEKEEITVSPILNKSWSWQKTEMMNDTLVTPKDPNKFILTFNEDNTFDTSTDCNRGFGKYSIEGSQLKFLGIGSTKMACPDSKEGIYFKDLQEVESYMIEDNKLILQLKVDAGIMTFTEVEN